MEVEKYDNENNSKKDFSNRRLSRKEKTLALSLASILTTLISTVTAMLMSRILKQSDLAAYRQTILAYQTFGPILGLGISQGLFYCLVRNSHRKKAIILESIILLLASGSLYGLFILIGGNALLAQRFSNPQVAEYLIFMVPYALIMIPSTIISPVLIAEEKIKTNTYFNVIGHLIITLAVVLSITFFKNVRAALISNVTVSILVFLTGLIIMYKSIPGGSVNIQWASIRQILTFSIPLGLSSMIGTIDKQLDRWIVSFMCSPEQFAVFSNGAFEVPFVDIITGAITAVVIVDMNKYAKEGNCEEALNLFKHAAEITSKCLIPLAVFLLVIAEPFIIFMFSERYIESIPILRVYLLYLPIRIVQYGALMIAIGKTKEILYRSIIGLIANAIVSIVLVRLFGAIGASVATILTIYMVNVPINLYIIAKYFNIRWYQVLPFKHIYNYFLLSIIPAVICYIVDNWLSGSNVIIRLGADTLVFSTIFILFYFKYNHMNVRCFINQYFRRHE